MKNKLIYSFIASLILLNLRTFADPIYLDNSAATPVDPRVLEAMYPHFTQNFANPNSSLHVYGIQAHEAIAKARKEIAEVINAEPNEIIFTSGATEANNIAILGVSRAAKAKGKTHIISVVTEHQSILEPLKQLEKEGFHVTLLPVEKNGLLNLENLKKALTPQTALVSVMAANNEIGVLQPIQDIAKISHEHGALFHTDATQAFGKIPLDVKENGIDLLSTSGKTIYAPLGIGALYVKNGVDILPISYGAGKKNEIRPGALPAPLCVSLGEAARLSENERVSESNRLLALRSDLINYLQNNLKGVTVNGTLNERLPGNLNVSFEGVDNKSLFTNLKNVAASIGEASAKMNDGPTHVIRAIYGENRLPSSTLRLSLGRFTTKEDVTIAAADIVYAVKKARGEN